VDALLAQGKLNRGPNIVAIGGGTGLSTLLSGLKRYSNNLTAIVTVADDGGSSGAPRRELGVQPPATSAIAWPPSPPKNRCSPACSRYRFKAGSGLEGHSFGNLFLSALSAITGSLESAITASSRVLAVQGQVVPATNADVRLWAELENGERIEGESRIGQAKSPIVRLGCIPERPPALPRALEAIAHRRFDPAGSGQPLHVVAPQPAGARAGGGDPAQQGTPALHLQPDDPARRNRWARCAGPPAGDRGPAGQPGRGERLFTAVLAQEELAHGPLVENYRLRGAEPVRCGTRQLKAEGYDVMLAPLQGARPAPPCATTPAASPWR
jgi:hypothetical protein